MKVCILIILAITHSAFASIECDVYTERALITAENISESLRSTRTYDEVSSELDHESDAHYLAWNYCFHQQNPTLERYCLIMRPLLTERVALIKSNVVVRDEYELGYLLYYNEGSQMMVRQACRDYGL